MAGQVLDRWLFEVPSSVVAGDALLQVAPGWVVSAAGGSLVVPGDLGSRFGRGGEGATVIDGLMGAHRISPGQSGVHGPGVRSRSGWTHASMTGDRRGSPTRFCRSRQHPQDRPAVSDYSLARGCERMTPALVDGPQVRALAAASSLLRTAHLPLWRRPCPCRAHPEQPVQASGACAAAARPGPVVRPA